MAKSKVELETPVVDYAPPDYLSPEWEEFIMGEFSEDELQNGFPMVHGLRRLAEKYVGVILESGPTQVFPVQGDRIGRATVVYSVTFERADNRVVTYADVADVWDGNVDPGFLAFAVAVASTRAEARALRKALKVKKCAAEELSPVVTKASDVNVTSDIISDNQIKFVDTLCKKLDINVVKFFNAGERTYRRAGEILKNTASKMIQSLNTLQNNTNDIPADIKGYNPQWAERFEE